MSKGEKTALHANAPGEDARAARQVEAPPNDNGGALEENTPGGARGTAPEAEPPSEGESCHAAPDAAVLRIGASLDLDTVLEEVMESARALTGAAHGVITTADEAGAPHDFVNSAFTWNPHRALPLKRRSGCVQIAQRVSFAEQACGRQAGR